MTSVQMKQFKDTLAYAQKYKVSNAEMFKRIFGIYATEFRRMPHDEYIKWMTEYWDKSNITK